MPVPDSAQWGNMQNRGICRVDALRMTEAILGCFVITGNINISRYSFDTVLFAEPAQDKEMTSLWGGCSRRHKSPGEAVLEAGSPVLLGGGGGW